MKTKTTPTLQTRTWVGILIGTIGACRFQRAGIRHGSVWRGSVALGDYLHNDAVMATFVYDPELSDGDTVAHDLDALALPATTMGQLFLPRHGPVWQQHCVDLQQSGGGRSCHRRSEKPGRGRAGCGCDPDGQGDLWLRGSVQKLCREGPPPGWGGPDGQSGCP